jgi:D-alanine transaminase
VDEQGYLTESYTENLAAVDAEGRLVILPPTSHLAGTTLERVASLAVEAGWTRVDRPLRPADLFEMKEVWVVGTTAYVTSLISLDGNPLPTGPQAGGMADRLRADIAGNAAMRTPVA